MHGPGKAFGEALFGDLAQMEQNMLALCDQAGELCQGLRRVLGAGGKRLRPMLAWVCWSMAGKQLAIIPLMTMLELMHSTSLIHDDFVDGAAQRRGVATISAESGGKAALRSGDYLLARAMEQLKVYRGTGINEALSLVAQEMCLGELDQQKGLFRMEGMAEADYHSRIRRKTALLMAESCRSGFVAGGGDKAVADTLFAYGLHLGLAFQLRDDLLDWESAALTGKPRLQDLRSGVITHPLLAAETGDGQLIKLAELREKTAEDLERIHALVSASGALEKTGALVRSQCGKAVEALSSLPESAEKKSLILLARSISEVNIRG